MKNQRKDEKFSQIPLGDMVEINPDSIKKSCEIDEIKYVDISSVGSGIKGESKIINFRDAPSRARRRVKSKDIILSTVRPNRRSFYYFKNPTQNTIVSTGFAVLRAKKEINSRFLYYCIMDQKFTDYLTLHAKGAAYPAVDVDTISKAKIPYFPKKTQRKIASILSAYDDLIENNLRRIEILEEMAQLIYREWFVHFRFPGHETVRMVDSTLGKIPEGWDVKRVGEVMEFKYGKALKKSDRKEGDVPVFGSSGVVGFHNEGIVEGPGIIVGRKGNVGSVFWSTKEFYPIDTVFYINSNIDLYYIYYNLKSQSFSDTDTAVPGLSRKQAYLNPFLLPEKRLLMGFRKQIEPIFSLIKIYEKKTKILEKTRDLLLPKLISGEVDVSELDIDTGRLEE